jgi:hypothetical protein
MNLKFMYTYIQLFAFFARPVLTTRAMSCCDNRGLFFLKNGELCGTNKDAAMRRQQYLRPLGSDAAADNVI